MKTIIKGIILMFIGSIMLATISLILTAITGCPR